MNSKYKTILTIAAFVAGTICFQAETNAQGFRIGNVMQAGGGQGFRLGGPRVGMHFGGGQGASFGAGRLGMRFGNGQGARIGGATYGMQFGGRQGSQIGRFTTTPMVAPGTYYYGDVGQAVYAVPVQGTLVQPSFVQPATYGQPVVAPMLNVPTPAAPGGAVTNNSVASPSTLTAPSVPADVADDIRLTHSAEATENMKFTANGSDFTLEPGKSLYLAAGSEWSLRFSAGAEHGDRVADLAKAGSFVFLPSPSEGWVLMDESQMNAEVEATDQIAIDEAPAESTLTNGEGGESILDNPTLDEPTLAAPDLDSPTLEAPVLEEPNLDLEIEAPPLDSEIDSDDK